MGRDTVLSGPQNHFDEQNTASGNSSTVLPGRALFPNDAEHQCSDLPRLGNRARQRIRQDHARIIERILSRPGRPGKGEYVDTQPDSGHDRPEGSTTKTYDDELSGPFEGDGQKSRLVNVSTVQGQFIGNSAAPNPVSSIASRRARSYAFGTHSST